MVCIYCQGHTKVTNSRPQKRANKIWRRRQCLQCDNIFTTLEGPDLTGSVMINSYSRLQPFLRDILFVSVYESCRHRKTATSDATALTDTIIGKLLPQINQATLQRDQIVTTVSEVLKRFDRAAQVQYEAYHPL